MKVTNNVKSITKSSFWNSPEPKPNAFTLACICFWFSFATSGGKTASQETSLTANKAVTLTIPTDISGGPGAPSGPSGTTPPPQYIPPVEVPQVPGPEFDIGIMVLVGVVISAVVVAAVFAKPKSQWQIQEQTRRKWRKKTKRRR